MSSPYIEALGPDLLLRCVVRVDIGCRSSLVWKESAVGLVVDGEDGDHSTRIMGYLRAHSGLFTTTHGTLGSPQLNCPIHASRSRVVGKGIL